MSPRRPWSRIAMAIGAVTLLATSVPATLAQTTYTVNVTPELNGLDVKIDPVSNAGMLVVNLENNAAQKVRCDLNFQADPQVPYRTFVFLDPGKKGSAVLRATQRWYEVDVDVKCRLADQK